MAGAYTKEMMKALSNMKVNEFIEITLPSKEGQGSPDEESPPRQLYHATAPHLIDPIVKRRLANRGHGLSDHLDYREVDGETPKVIFDTDKLNCAAGYPTALG